MSRSSRGLAHGRFFLGGYIVTVYCTQVSIKEARVKLKIYTVDFEIPARVKKWGLRIGILGLALGGTAVALAGGPLHTWATGDVLQASDLNANFANLQGQITSGFVLAGDDLHNNNPSGLVGIGTATPSAALDVNGQLIRKIARVHGNGPNESTANGAIASRLLQYTKTQDATGLRVAWGDNLRCLGVSVSCEWEIKIDGASCTTPGPLTYDVYNDAGAATVGSNSVDIHRPESHVGTCFGISKGMHTIQIFVKAPVPLGPVTFVGSAGTPWTGWNGAYWSIEAEEVY